MQKTIFFCLLAGPLSLSSFAVVVSGGDGTQNTAAPAGDQGWSNVGKIIAANGAPTSVTYLQNNWFITAYHVKYFDNPYGVSLGGSDYSIVSDSWTRITNSTGTHADLVLFQAEEMVSAPGVNVVSDPLSLGTGVTMIGNGQDRYAGELELAGETLYLVKSGKNNTSKRWGTNTIEGNSGPRFLPLGNETTYTDSYYTDFDDGEAQAALYDSGGGVFAQQNNAWALSGIMIQVGNTYKIDGTNAVMLTGGSPNFNGSWTYVADLSSYSDQINSRIGAASVPEPMVAGLVISFGVGIIMTRRLFQI